MSDVEPTGILVLIRNLGLPRKQEIAGGIVLGSIGTTVAKHFARDDFYDTVVGPLSVLVSDGDIAVHVRDRYPTYWPGTDLEVATTPTGLPDLVDEYGRPQDVDDGLAIYIEADPVEQATSLSFSARTQVSPVVNTGGVYVKPRVEISDGSVTGNFDKLTVTGGTVSVDPGDQDRALLTFSGGDSASMTVADSGGDLGSFERIRFITADAVDVDGVTVEITEPTPTITVADGTDTNVGSVSRLRFNGLTVSEASGTAVVEATTPKITVAGTDDVDVGDYDRVRFSGATVTDENAGEYVTVDVSRATGLMTAGGTSIDLLGNAQANRVLTSDGAGNAQFLRVPYRVYENWTPARCIVSASPSYNTNGSLLLDNTVTLVLPSKPAESSGQNAQVIHSIIVYTEGPATWSFDLTVDYILNGGSVGSITETLSNADTQLANIPFQEPGFANIPNCTYKLTFANVTGAGLALAYLTVRYVML